MVRTWVSVHLKLESFKNLRSQAPKHPSIHIMKKHIEPTIRVDDMSVKH
jgi:hypothetical protein